MSSNENYGRYDPDINHPFSPHLSVEQGSGTKGRAKKNTIVSMEALPGFIHRMKPTKCGKHKNKNVDGIVEDSFQELAEESDEHLDAIDRHLGQMLTDPDGEVWNLLD